MSASRYRIGRSLGSGGAAEVFEAVLIGEAGFERRVALKRPLASEDPSAHAAFIDEARIASALHHANIAGVIDFGVSEDGPFLVAELVDGIDLATAIDRADRVGGVPLTVALHVTNEVAHALDHAHGAVDAAGRAMAIVHRDVSPENVLLSWQGDVKLTDFGIAHALRRSRTEATRAGVAKGKLGYVAPEQLGGAALDGRVDLFALGCVLHALVVGSTPLADPVQRAAILRGESPPLEPQIPDDVRAILARALHGDRRARYPDAAAMAAALGEALIERLTQDGRTTLRAWLARLERPPIAEEKRRDLFGLELVLTGAREPVRRFDTRAVGGERGEAGAGEATPGRGERAGAREHAPRGASVLDEGTEPTAMSRARSPSAYDATAISSPRAAALTSPTSRPDPTPATAPAPSAPPPDPLLGEIIHGFRIEAPIGRGATARLYRAQHLTLERRYAVKLLHADIATNPRWMARFRREAQQLSRIRDPHVVEVLDFGTTAGGQPFLAMDFLDGRPLGEAIAEDGPFPPARARAVARDVCAGLAAIEREGLVHRDIKPSNVMLVPHAGGERAVIVDFGLVRALEPDELAPLTQQGVVLGTPAYMAPEQIERPHEATAAADRYALGALLFAMLVGRPPFGRQALEAIDGHRHRPVPPLPPSEGLEALVVALMAKAPDQRPGTEAVRAMLEAMPAATHTHTHTHGVPTQTQPVFQRHFSWNWPRVALLLLAMMGVGLVGGLWVQDRAASRRAAQAQALREAEAEANARARLEATRAPATPIAAIAPPSPSAVPAAPPDATPLEAHTDRDPPGATTSPPRATASPRASRRPSPSDEPTDRVLERLRITFAMALHTRGLRSAADLDALGSARAARAVEAALRAGDAATAERLISEAETEIARAIVDTTTIDRLIERLEPQLRQLSPEQRAPLEERQIDLLDRATRRDLRTDPVRTQMVILELIDFERDVARALR